MSDLPNTVPRAKKKKDEGKNKGTSPNHKKKIKVEMTSPHTSIDVTITELKTSKYTYWVNDGETHGRMGTLWLGAEGLICPKFYTFFLLCPNFPHCFARIWEGS